MENLPLLEAACGPRLAGVAAWLGPCPRVGVSAWPTTSPWGRMELEVVGWRWLVLLPQFALVSSFSVCWSVKCVLALVPMGQGLIWKWQTGFWRSVFQGWSSSDRGCNCLMIFHMDFRVGCYRTASAGSALGSFCPCLLWLPSLPPALSGGAECSLWAGQLASVHSHSLLIYIYLDFLLPCVRPKSETCHVFPIKSVDLVQMDCLSLHTSPLHQPRSAWL